MLFFVIRRGKTTIKTETVKRKSLFWLRVKSKLKGQVEGSQEHDGPGTGSPGPGLISAISLSSQIPSLYGPQSVKCSGGQVRPHYGFPDMGLFASGSPTALACQADRQVKCWEPTPDLLNQSPGDI